MSGVPTSFHLGPLVFHTYGFGLAIAAYVCFLYARRRLAKADFDVAPFGKYAFALIVAGLIGARLANIATNWGYYSDHPARWIAVWQGGLASFGGIGAGAAGRSLPAASMVARRVRSPRSRDALVPALIAGWALGRVLGPQFMVNGGGHLTHQWFGHPLRRTGRQARARAPHPRAPRTALLWLMLLAVEHLSTAIARVGVITGVAMIVWGVVRSTRRTAAAGTGVSQRFARRADRRSRAGLGGRRSCYVAQLRVGRSTPDRSVGPHAPVTPYASRVTATRCVVDVTDVVESESAPRLKDVPRRRVAGVDRTNQEGVVARGDDEGRSLLRLLLRCRRVGGVKGHLDDDDGAHQRVLGIESFELGGVKMIVDDDSRPRRPGSVRRAAARTVGDGLAFAGRTGRCGRRSAPSFLLFLAPTSALFLDGGSVCLGCKAVGTTTISGSSAAPTPRVPRAVGDSAAPPGTPRRWRTPVRRRRRRSTHRRRTIDVDGVAQLLEVRRVRVITQRGDDLLQWRHREQLQQRGHRGDRRRRREGRRRRVAAAGFAAGYRRPH